MDTNNPNTAVAALAGTALATTQVATENHAEVKALKDQPASNEPKPASTPLPKDGKTTPEVKAAKPKYTKLITIALIALAVVAIGVITWWFTRPPLVPAVTARFTPLVRTLQFSARLATSARVEIGSTITGRVIEVLVIEGSDVKKGDALIRLENDELRAAAGQADAGVSQAAARLEGLKSTGRSVADAAVAQADSVLTKAQAELRRTQDLATQGFISQTRLEEARSAATVAEAQRTSAVAQSAANRGTEVAQAQAQVAVSRAAGAVANARLAQGIVTAPADAKVLARLVELGQIVQPGRALFNLALVGPLQLVAQVDERYLEQLKIGQSASVVADAYPAERFAASIQIIAPIVDAQRGAVQVKLSIPNQPPAFLREDMTLSVEVETGKRDRALAVPVEALHGDETSNLSTVFIERNGHVEQRNVRVGMRTLKLAEIVEGLAEGDTVLTGPTLKAGSRVRAKIPENAASGPDGSTKDAAKEPTQDKKPKHQAVVAACHDRYMPRCNHHDASSKQCLTG
jgi:HlyD family secretion protein